MVTEVTAVPEIELLGVIVTVAFITGLQAVPKRIDNPNRIEIITLLIMATFPIKGLGQNKFVSVHLWY
jgi:hypothetical protein